MDLKKNKIIEFLRSVYGKDKNAIIAVSGGVDSALALTLLVQAIGSDRVYPLCIPYKNQNMDDAHTIIEWNGCASRMEEINIGPTVEHMAQELGITDEGIRKGNLMARIRMIAVYDRAKKLNALVCGTENKSEHYLGYFTRFGDAASDVEPLLTLYKTDVWEMANELGLPELFYTKAPSAGLWEGQTDEQELGFGYKEADKVLGLMIDKTMSVDEIKKTLEPKLVDRVVEVVKKNEFKREVPYSRIS